MADLVMEIIFARDIGGLESIKENNSWLKALTASMIAQRSEPPPYTPKFLARGGVY